ncbi:hypothetical protein COK29_30795, partial [Bacillus cereus]|uniref:hypothetical protein n=1 Tax=Bacillus cereus TaxID=1396 RepID=UPI000C010720
SKGINYIVNNFFETKEFLTGDVKKDYFITQLALRVFQDGNDNYLKDAQGRYYSDPDGVIPSIQKIATKAMNEGLDKPFFNNHIEVASDNPT